MFLVSNQDMVTETSLAGGLGTFPTLNCRSSDELDLWIQNIKKKVGDHAYGVNLIVHKSNERYLKDKEVVLDHKVPLIISSLGNPQKLIKEAHSVGSKVICDVINKKHARKALSVKADGLIVVSVGAGGHAGTLSPFCSLPYFRKAFPESLIIAAGGVASGKALLASLALGADGVSVGTRFIASEEAQVERGYKEAIKNSGPEDIFMSPALSGVKASIIKTKHNQDFYEWDQSFLGKAQQYLTYTFLKRGLKLKKKFSWSNVWSAGQSVGEVEEVLSCKEIIESFIQEYEEIKKLL